MTKSARTKDVAALSGDTSKNAQFYKRDFWMAEGPKFAEPHFRMRKAAVLVTRIAAGRECDLLDVGCGPAALMSLLPGSMHYYGIDIAIQQPASNLVESDFVDNRIEFGGKQFDIVIAQGVFEYLGDTQARKLAEIRALLRAGGTFVVTYTNFGHRNRHIYSAYSNVKPLAEFRESLTKYFHVDRSFPASHNWQHGQPNGKVMKTIQMPINVNVPFVSPLLAVEYFFVCS